jgi:hypothetical protein
LFRKKKATVFKRLKKDYRASPISNEPAEFVPQYFSLVAENNSPENKYIQSAKLNGKPYNKCYIYYRTIIDGGKLELVMGPKPNEKWGIE